MIIYTRREKDNAVNYNSSNYTEHLLIDDLCGCCGTLTIERFGYKSARSSDANKYLKSLSKDIRKALVAAHVYNKAVVVATTTRNQPLANLVLKDMGFKRSIMHRPRDIGNTIYLWTFRVKGNIERK